MQPKVTDYGVAFAAVAAAVAIRWLLDPLLGDTLPLVTLFGAVAVAVWWGGYRPALVITIVGYLACAYLFIQPRGAFGFGEPRNLVGLVAYLVTCSIIIAFGQALRIAQRRADERRELLRVTIASVGDAVITTDADGRVATMNPVAEDLTGWTQQDASGMLLETVFNIINEGTRQPVENPVKKVLANGKVVGLANHSILIAKDNTERSIDDSAAPIRDAAGTIVGVVLIFRDISERRKSERVVAQARAYAESIVDSVREPLLVLDAQLRVVTASRSFFQTFHVTREETQGKLFHELGNRQWNIDELRKLLEEVLTRNTQFDDYEVEADFPHIGRRVMLLNARRIYREGNHSELVLLAIEDITARKMTHKNERTLASIVESSDDAIISKSLDGIITSWNPGAERLFGYTAEQAIGRHISFLFPADRFGEEDQIIARLRAGERVDHFDTVRVRSDGQHIQVSLTISPIKDESGRVIGASKIARDITERVQAQEALRRYAAELAEADRRKNEFLAMLAHELRNPLVPIRNAGHIMRLKGGDDEAVAAASEMMERQVGQMVRLVDDLLNVSRISRGKIELKKERVELASVVHHAVEAIRPNVEGKNQELTVTLPPAAILLNADQTRLAQVLGNLLTNACKFTDMGGRIALVVEHEGQQAIIRVRDNGIGIAAEQLPRIFDLFVQVDTTLERTTSGLGIGLTLVKSIVELHDGSVEAKSGGVGQGSEFIVRLPILVEAPSPKPQPTSNEPARSNGRRVLVVDDNRDAAETLAMLLKLTGHETHMAHDGLEAIEAAESIRPDVVLLDIGLPKLNGYEAGRRIREQPWGKDIVMVALTGWGQEDDRRKSSDAGFNGHLVKPVDLAALTKFLVAQ